MSQAFQCHLETVGQGVFDNDAWNKIGLKAVCEERWELPFTAQVTTILFHHWMLLFMNNHLHICFTLLAAILYMFPFLWEEDVCVCSQI